jgi:hypothetical protein
MSILTAAIYQKLASDVTLTDMLATFGDEPAVFTTDPVPGSAELPYVVSTGEVSQSPFDTKQTRGRSLIRDVRCYAAADGSAVLIEAIAERVRALLHRQALTINGYSWMLSDVTGPIVADDDEVYGRIISVNIVVQQTEV